jgi:tetratricopeptide (TPR) repeat protein
MPQTRLFSRDAEDKLNSIKRSFSDAEQGRLELALERLRDLLDEFPSDAHVLYAQGIILRDRLGSGLDAREHFERAFRAASPNEEVHGNAACNVASLARNESELWQWLDTAERDLPNDQAVKSLREMATHIKASGYAYLNVLADRAAHEGTQLGASAAKRAVLLEIALAFGTFRVAEEVNLRRNHAQALRQLDQAAQNTREMLCEYMPPAERLTLHRALDEIARATALDEFDAELWNLRAAWCMLLRRNEEAVAFAKKSIALRPHNYAKPWTNQATALWNLDRPAEALDCAREAIRQAQAAQDSKDLESAEKLKALFERGKIAPDNEAFVEWAREFHKAAMLTSRKEISQKGWSGDYAVLIDGFLKRAQSFGTDWNPAYIHIAAEMLTFFSAETAFAIMLQSRDKNVPAYDHALHALLYVIAHSTSVMQRDAARVLCLAILWAPDLPHAREMYRKAVLETGAASPAEFGVLHTVVRAELARIGFTLAERIADQEPVDQAGCERARRAILWRFSGRTKPAGRGPDVGTAAQPAHRSPPALQNADGACGSFLILLVLGGIGYAVWKYNSNASQTSPIQAGDTGEIIGTVVLCIVAAMVVFRMIAAVGRQAMREQICAECSRPFQKIPQPPYANFGRVMISTQALRSGAEGVGRECQSCGRTYCSWCADEILACECGSRQLKMVRLAYRPGL